MRNRWRFRADETHQTLSINLLLLSPPFYFFIFFFYVSPLITTYIYLYFFLSPWLLWKQYINRIKKLSKLACLKSNSASCRLHTWTIHVKPLCIILLLLKLNIIIMMVIYILFPVNDVNVAIMIYNEYFSFRMLR